MIRFFLQKKRIVPVGTLLIGLALPPDMNVGATLFGPRAAGPVLGDIQNSALIYEMHVTYTVI